jgi:DNA-directed RNA polymerase specialized sigma24 family protein
MCLIDNDDLFNILNDAELFSRFALMEREQRILRMHMLQGFKFETIASLEKISLSRARQLYTRGLKKMRQQVLATMRNLTHCP